MRLRSSLVPALALTWAGAMAGSPAWGQAVESAPAGVVAAPAAASAAAPSPAAPSPAASAPAASASAVVQAVIELRDEGHFGKKHPERYLRFKRDKEPTPNPPERAGASGWLRDFAAWLNRVGRVGIWTLCALLAAMFVVVAMRMRRVAARETPLHLPEDAPQRVRQYDIRPQSLPENVGATAWAQWQQGDLRAALVLLYRGALSRLVHRHGLPIRASSTEGDCMALAQRHVAAATSDYFARVTRARLIGSYAGRWPEAEEVRELCQLFELRLAAPAAGSGEGEPA